MPCFKALKIFSANSFLEQLNFMPLGRGVEA